jgi:urease accessory protein
VTAAVVASATLRGGTRCTTLRSAPPISLRETAEGLFLVASGAGPVGGDDLELDVAVGAGASLVVRSAAAQLVLPGPTGAPSTLTIRARVEGSLVWEPEPTVLVAGCDHTTTVQLDLAEDASVEWRETVVLGRHGEASGSMLQRLVVERAGRPLLRNEVPLGPRWPGSDGPAGVHGARVVTSVLVVGGDEPNEPGDGAVLQLADDAWLVTRLGDGGGFCAGSC